MNAIQWFQLQKANLADARSWAGLIGKKYSGGGGGYGEITKVNAIVTVYHQEYDGATNYHEAPKAMREAIEATIREQGGQIIASALARLEAYVRDAAKKAEAEAQAVLDEARRG